MVPDDGNGRDRGSSVPNVAAQMAGAVRNLDSLEFVLDVPVEVTVEIGRKRMKISEILRLGTGAVLELSKTAGEPLDIYVNNRAIARGEAVVVGDHYGIRLTEVLITEETRGKPAPSQ